MASNEDWEVRIRAAQGIPTVSIAGIEYPRIRYGDEAEDWGADRGPCHGCGAVKGQLHAHVYCDAERCPACGGQALYCECVWD